jgi:hypothetical protein
LTYFNLTSAEFRQTFPTGLNEEIRTARTEQAEQGTWNKTARAAQTEQNSQNRTANITAIAGQQEPDRQSWAARQNIRT